MPSLNEFSLVILDKGKKKKRNDAQNALAQTTLDAVTLIANVL